MTIERQLISRKRNWLPIPGTVRVAPRVEEPQFVDEDDNFSKATVETYFPRQRYGFLKTDTGHRVQFNLDVVQLVGEKADAQCIREGARVGYDLGCTSLGPRVCTLKVY